MDRARIVRNAWCGEFDIRTGQAALAMFLFAKPVGLRAFVGQYASERGLTNASQQALIYVVNSFAKHLARAATVADFRQDRVNEWLAALRVAGLDPETIRNRRTALLGMWRHAHDAGLVKHPPARIATVKVPKKIPRCWWLHDFAQLVAAAQAQTGTMRRDSAVMRRDFAAAFVLVGYDLGIRRGDLLRLGFDDVASDGTVALVQHKTNVVLVGKLQPQTLEAVNRLRGGGRKLVFGELVRETGARRIVQRLTRQAGLPGSTKWLRRTGATWVEVNTPGGAPAYLGHSDRRTAYHSYVDPAKIQTHRPSPPAVGP